jgi:ABC transporter substrate binding protein
MKVVPVTLPLRWRRCCTKPRLPPARWDWSSAACSLQRSHRRCVARSPCRNASRLVETSTGLGISVPISGIFCDCCARAASVQLLAAQGPGDFDEAFAAMRRHGADALLLFPSPMLYLEHRRVVDVAKSSRLPAIYAAREFVDAGGLMSYGANLPALFRRTATYVDKIFKGAKPADDSLRDGAPISHPNSERFGFCHDDVDEKGCAGNCSDARGRG